MPFFGWEHAWNLDEWPWEHGTVRILPVAHGRLEFARAVRAHLDHWSPDVVVVEIPGPAGAAWLEAVGRLPRIHAVQIDVGDQTAWLLAEPVDPAVEAARWALARRRRVVAGDLLVTGYSAHVEQIPDPAVIPQIGYRGYVDALVGLGRPPDPSDRDLARERALARAAWNESDGETRVALVTGLFHARRILELLQRGQTQAEPLARPLRPGCRAVAIHQASLGECLSEPPFLQAAWERARSGRLPALYAPPRPASEEGRILAFPGAGTDVAEDRTEAPDEDARAEAAALTRGEDVLARPRLLYRLVQQAMRLAREQGGGSVPDDHERNVLHRYARNMALLSGRVCADLYELVTAARGAVDDRFARDLLEVAVHWPWPNADGVRLGAADLGHRSRVVRLRPRLDRLSGRPALRRALRLAAEGAEGPPRICSHTTEDLVVEALGAELRDSAGALTRGGAARVQPFDGSLLNGLDVRETLRRFPVDGRPWVREETSRHARVGAVVIIFAEDDDQVEGERAVVRYPWAEVWHGEHDQESDMAFYATQPDAEPVAPGIYRAEYGGFLLTWPPRRVGDIWHDPAYDPWVRTRPERLLLAAIDYSPEPAVVYVARRAPGVRLLSLARRLGRRVIHVPPGVLSRDRLRKVRQFHVLTGPHLRPLAKELLD